MLNRPLPSDDLTAVLQQADAAFEGLRDARIFVTGGTGFFGHWMLESLLLSNRVKDLRARVVVLTRDAAGFRKSSPWIADQGTVELLEGNVQSFDFPVGEFSHILHAATDSGGRQTGRSTEALQSDILKGTQRVLDFARASGARRLLYVSTGAVYGRSSSARYVLESLLEQGVAALPEGSYESAKRASEVLCLEQAQKGLLECVIARPFAFVGPRLPLDAHFAIGNFLNAALRGEAIVVKGDGTPRRSWMYMSDLTVWLWTMLVKGAAGRAYNVGSEEAYSIREAAVLTGETLAPETAVEVLGEAVVGATENSYVPSVERAAKELGLAVTVPLREALRRTARWYSDLPE